MSDILTKVTKTASGNFKIPGRLSYPNLLEPRLQSDKPGAKLKYSTALLVPPTVDLTEVKAACAVKAKEKFGDKVKGAKSPFLDAVEKGAPDEFKGWTLIRLNSDMKPDVVGPNPRDHIEESREIYPGRWARVSCNPYGYEAKDERGNVVSRGVSLGLNNVQLLDHDEPLASVRTRAEDDFEEVNVANANAGEKTGAADDVFA